MRSKKNKVAVEVLSDLCSTRKLSMRDELPRVKEAELELTSAERNACIGLLYNTFHSCVHICHGTRRGPHFSAPNRVSRYEHYGMIIDMGVHLPMIQDIWYG